MRLFVTVGLAAAMLAPTRVEARMPSLRCDTIRPGETAFAVARRVTGRAENLRREWFRVVDRRRVIPKAGYNRVRAGWRACVPAERHLAREIAPSAAPSTARWTPPAPAASADVVIRSASVGLTARPSLSPRPLLSSPPGAARSSPPQPSRTPPARDWPVALVFMCLGPAAFGAAIGFGWQSVERAVTRRRALTRELQQFGDRFIRDFERPLQIAGVVARPVRARRRCVAHDRRLEILLAPAAGHRYPNLDDHRRNVEYDVERIARHLGDDRFVPAPLRVDGAWVVIPFQFNPGLGVRPSKC